jgi:hypothetical protein
MGIAQAGRCRRKTHRGITPRYIEGAPEAGPLGLAIGGGLVLGYAAGTGLDNATGGGWGHWWYNALGGADAPGALPPALLPTIHEDVNCRYYIDPLENFEGHTNDECVKIWEWLLDKINKLSGVSSDYKRVLRSQAFDWLSRCTSKATDKGDNDDHLGG